MLSVQKNKEITFQKCLKSQHVQVTFTGIQQSSIKSKQKLLPSKRTCKKQTLGWGMLVEGLV